VPARAIGNFRFYRAQLFFSADACRLGARSPGATDCNKRVLVGGGLCYCLALPVQSASLFKSGRSERQGALPNARAAILLLPDRLSHFGRHSFPGVLTPQTLHSSLAPPRDHEQLSGTETAPRAGYWGAGPSLRSDGSAQPNSLGELYRSVGYMGLASPAGTPRSGPGRQRVDQVRSKPERCAVLAL